MWMWVVRKDDHIPPTKADALTATASRSESIAQKEMAARGLVRRGFIGGRWFVEIRDGESPNAGVRDLDRDQSDTPLFLIPFLLYSSSGSRVSRGQDQQCARIRLENCRQGHLLSNDSLDGLFCSFIGSVRGSVDHCSSKVSPVSN